MNKKIYLVIPIAALLCMSYFFGCDKTTNPADAASTVTIDPQLVGAWYTGSTTEGGVEISQNGTFRFLMVTSQGKLDYDNSGLLVSGKFTKASGGVFASEELREGIRAAQKELKPGGKGIKNGVLTLS